MVDVTKILLVNVDKEPSGSHYVKLLSGGYAMVLVFEAAAAFVLVVFGGGRCRGGSLKGPEGEGAATCPPHPRPTSSKKPCGVSSSCRRSCAAMAFRTFFFEVS